jgi:hypothetical protein
MKNYEIRQTRRHLEYALDKYFDDGWAEFAKEMKEKINKSNIRLFQVISKMFGHDTASDIVDLYNEYGAWGLMKIQREASGHKVNWKRGVAIKSFLIDAQSGPDGMTYTICVEIAERRFISFKFIQN